MRKTSPQLHANPARVFPMPLPDSVAYLIETFRNNEADYTRPDFKEAQVRQQFLDPLFNALGWDTANAAGYAEAYKEVVHEDAIRIRGETKAPDYSFRIGGQRKFFVEAKKPSVNIKDDPAPAYQLRRYSWTVGLPLGILTDFQEISVYDTRIRPRAADKASTARIFHWRYTDLPAKWGEFAGLFSKEAILKGAFDRFANAKRGKHGTSAFDVEFLADIEKWRELLARNIALRNPSLSQRELNFSVQRILDRIIFLRIAEARGIEPIGKLQSLTAGANTAIVEEEPAAYGGAGGAGGVPARRQTIYPRLREIFERADFRYNSGLFHFETEKGRDEAPDKLTLALSIDDLPLRQIINALYYPESPYAFDYIEADILGSIYERFLGKTIRLTDGHRAVIEEKPEVRKAGGVYYTPKYIVDYIVRQTLDPLLEGKTPKQAEKIKVLDPACGSGSFLIGAYQHLLDWHLQYYTTHDPKKWARQKNPPVYETSPNARGIGQGDGNWQLTTAERKRILLANIHGVDIDAQAVEVTKLALLLKVLEGEARELQGKTGDFYRVLPDLGKNIQCGNSLIGHDFYQQPELPLLDDEAKYKLNTFEWKDGFPEIMKSGGFDAVIGNPPYGDLSDGAAKNYLVQKQTDAGLLPDFYALFMSQAFHLLNEHGYLGYIIPSAWLGGPLYKKLRERILERSIEQIIDLPFDVFKDAYVDTLMLIMRSENPKKGHKARCYSFPKKQKIIGNTIGEIELEPIAQEKWKKSDDFKITLNPGLTDILIKLRKQHRGNVGDLAEMKRGVLFPKHILTKAKTCPESHPFFEGDVYRYQLNYSAPNWVEFGGKMTERPKEFHWFAGNRLLMRRLVNRQQRIMCCHIDKTVITNKNLYSIRSKSADTHLGFLLAVLNSKLISKLYISQVSQAGKDDFPQVTMTDIIGLPIPLEVDDDTQKRLAKLADQMQFFQVQLLAAKTPDEQIRLQREITATDRQIDALVYQLYGLTEDEIALIEQTTT